MAKSQNPQRQGRPGPPASMPPRGPTYRFRRSVLLVPLACLLGLWLVKHLEPSIDWEDILWFLHVNDRDGYSRLAVLGLLLVGALVVLRTYRED